MQKPPLVAVLGDSILMEGIATQLAQSQEIEMLRLAPDGCDIPAYIRRLRPDTVVFELGACRIEDILLGLCEQICVLLLGFDLDCQRAVVMRSTQIPIRSMSDLDCLFAQELSVYTRHP